ncbi:hypothetical protein GGTG_03108 [Gaeumannomyces tritici R3-111a-1]|uniref:LysM domain-containing protein n=1 Tax=Gaeumannomyces tritici (strain R3-111a-1) TaxID=644352 RepID=J3NPA2_GAET3|nr:hypothetical protein GGTG_03108 [Gaeumannomyces tritici R3-111a-1]EJT78005.1 hypothetical protein GGTG_03108 [Gaeumannomyces tritici R3-111a-1]
MSCGSVPRGGRGLAALRQRAPCLLRRLPDERQPVHLEQVRALHSQGKHTCLSIAKPRGLAQVQLTTWNPILGDLCRSMKNSIGDSIRVSPPGEPDYTISPYPTTTGPPVQTVPPVPPNTAPNTTTNCVLYHFVAEGEHCNKLVVKYSISLPNFLFLCIPPRVLRRCKIGRPLQHQQ